MSLEAFESRYREIKQKGEGQFDAVFDQWLKDLDLTLSDELRSGGGWELGFHNARKDFKKAIFAVLDNWSKEATANPYKNGINQLCKKLEPALKGWEATTVLEWKDIDWKPYFPNKQTAVKVFNTLRPELDEALNSYISSGAWKESVEETVKMKVEKRREKRKEKGKSKGGYFSLEDYQKLSSQREQEKVEVRPEFASQMRAHALQIAAELKADFENWTNDIIAVFVNIKPEDRSLLQESLIRVARDLEIAILQLFENWLKNPISMGSLTLELYAYARNNERISTVVQKGGISFNFGSFFRNALKKHVPEILRVSVRNTLWNFSMEKILFVICSSCRGLQSQTVLRT